MLPSHISLPNITATEQLARRLAPHLGCGDVLALEGELGTGKTTFTRFLLRALGVGSEVPSPTFTLLQTYDTPHFPVCHCDFYRLKSEAELDELGWDDACALGLVIVEWPERGAARMPRDYLVLHFSIDASGLRSCAIEPHGTWQQRMKGIP